MKTSFTCTAPNAQKVYLAGTFNEWSPTSTPMKKGGKGIWSLTLDLPPGHVEFKFVVDDAWCCEPGCDGPHKGCQKCVQNSYGTMNRVCEVG